MKPDRWKQIDDLLDLALTKAPEQREAFLTDVCAGDEDLRRELDSLLAHHELSGTFLEAPPMDVAADLFPEEHGFNEGRLIGNYQVISMIGSGGMGEVYLAKDRRLNRTVALKVLAASVASDPAYRRRFEDEARLASNLNHPNIVTIYGVGDEGDLTYIAMEFVRGRTLRNMLADGALPLETVLDIALQIADALTAAHEGGVVHRDLKPENIMVTGNGLVKVLDFGLARQHRIERHSRDKAGAQTALTGAGMILGTVGYMSPEQAWGRWPSTPQISFRSARFSTKCFRAGGPSNAKLQPRRSQQSSGNNHLRFRS